jgi:hypothetical protein
MIFSGPRATIERRYRLRMTVAILSAVVYLVAVPPLLAEERSYGPVRLSTGREVHLVEGRIRAADARALYREASEFLQAGRLEPVYEAAQLLTAKGEPVIADEARRLLASAEEIDFSSVVVLRSGAQITGRIRTPLRSDRLGLEGKEDIPFWKVERIEAEYLINYSAVSKTFYPYTLVEVRFRGGSSATGRLAAESELLLERRDGSLARLFLGLPFELLREGELARRVEQQSKERVGRVLVYSGLATLTPPSRGSGR